jgi:hypothetical protein
MSLTNEQIKLIATYWNKWQTVASNAEPVVGGSGAFARAIASPSENRSQTTQAINFLYGQANLDEPEVIFITNPHSYYAQAFLCSMPDDIQATLEPMLRNNPNNLFLDETGDNIAQILARQFLLPIESLNGAYLRQTLIKIEQGKSLAEARREADEEVYSQENRIILKTIAQIDIQFQKQFGASKIDSILHIENNKSWMGAIYDSLYSNLNIPKASIAEVIDRGYHDFSGIQVGCFDRVLLAFACARFDCLREILDLEIGVHEEVVRSLVQSGGKLFLPYQRICLVCEPLDILSFYNKSA